jgi:hypothetical protein
MSTPLDNGRLARRIRRGGTTVGSFSGLGSPAAAEVMAAAGAEWILLDLEHGGGSERLVGHTVPAVGAYGAATLARVEQAERIRIGRVLDAGAAGVMLPRLSSAVEVEEAVRHLRYPPAGDRGVATYNRSVRWGMDRGALDRAGEEALTIVQIETLGALEEVERIAAIDGVEVLFVGPWTSPTPWAPRWTSSPGPSAPPWTGCSPRPPRPGSARVSSVPPPTPRASGPSRASASWRSARTPPSSPRPRATSWPG